MVRPFKPLRPPRRRGLTFALPTTILAKYHPPMPTVAEILAHVETLAPPHYAYSFDKIGLQIGDPSASVEKIVVTLDPSLAAFHFALENHAQLVVAHHPVIWDPLRALVAGDPYTDRARFLVENKLAFIAAHTNWDCAPGGVNDTLANLLDLAETRSFGGANPEPMLKLVVFTPSSHRETLLDALAGIGAGEIGEYSRCAFHHPGTGTFRPGPGANPAVGQPGRVESTPEDRLELILPARLAEKARAAIRQTHPYEEPAFDFLPLLDRPAHPIGRLGSLPEPLNPQGLRDHIDHALGTRCQLWLPSKPTSAQSKPIKTLAVVGGAACDEWKAALAAGADAFLTGEVPQHVAHTASEAGIAIVAAGHYHTEHPGMETLARALAERVHLPVTVYTPPPGHHGRPL